MSPSTAAALRRLLETLPASTTTRDLRGLSGYRLDSARLLEMDGAVWAQVTPGFARALRDLDVAGALLEIDEHAR